MLPERSGAKSTIRFGARLQISMVSCCVFNLHIETAVLRKGLGIEEGLRVLPKMIMRQLLGATAYFKVFCGDTPYESLRDRLVLFLNQSHL